MCPQYKEIDLINQEVPTHDNMRINKVDCLFELVILLDYYPVPSQDPVLKLIIGKKTHVCMNIFEQTLDFSYLENVSIFTFLLDTVSQQFLVFRTSK